MQIHNCVYSIRFKYNRYSTQINANKGIFIFISSYRKVLCKVDIFAMHSQNLTRRNARPLRRFVNRPAFSLILTREGGPIDYYNCRWPF